MQTAARIVAVAIALVSIGGSGLRAADWTIELLYGDDEIYPSVLVSATEKSPFPPAHPRQLGDPRALVAAEFPPQAAARRVTVTVDETEIFERSSITVTLPASALTYRVAPPLVLRHDRIFALRHPIARALLTVTVEEKAPTSGKTKQETRHRSVRILAVTDWMKYVAMPLWLMTEAQFAGRDKNWPWLATQYLAGAFVNENNTVLARRIIRWAKLAEPGVSYDGYGAEGPERAARVRAQVRAVYNAMKAQGFKYATLFQSSSESAVAYSTAQRVRLPGDTLGSRQANCIDGTVFFASVLRQLGLRPYLYITQRHAYLGVALDPDGRKIMPVETTLVASEPFETAVSEAEAAEKKAPQSLDFRNQPAEKLLSVPDDKVFFRIDLAEARTLGVISLGEIVRHATPVSP